MKLTPSEVLSTGQTVALFWPDANKANFFSVNKTTPKKNLTHVQPSWHVWLLTHIISCCLKNSKDKLTFWARWCREFSFIRRVDWRDQFTHRAKPGKETTDTFLRTDEEVITCRLQPTMNFYKSEHFRIIFKVFLVHCCENCNSS